MSLMKATDFFKKSITDNQYSPIVLKDVIALNWDDFNCKFTKGQRGSTKEAGRFNALTSFLNELRITLSNINLKDFNISYLSNDDEFDFDQGLNILGINGDNFNNHSITSGNVVGSINFKGKQVNINCRFGNQFLEYMIANTSGFIELERFGSLSNNEGLGEWILLLYWRNCLKKAFANGIYKTYQKKRENLNTVRGSIDINHWMNKSYFDGKTMCEFKEHSFDNNINRVIYHALQKVTKSAYSSIIEDIFGIKRAFDSISFKDRSYSLETATVSNGYYKNYNEVYELSKRILQDQFMSFSEHDSEFSAFLFDISLLFEHHIRKVVSSRFTIRPKDLCEYKIPNGVTESKIFPDLIIDYGNDQIGVFDVKYKRFQTYGASPGVKREDRFQLISYIASYLNSKEVVSSGIIYPCEEGDYSHLMNNSKRDQIIHIADKEIPFGVYFYKVDEKDINNQPKFDLSLIHI